MPESSEHAQTLRQLSIKTGVVRRLHKEEQVYKNEVEAQRGVLQKLKDEEAEGADIRNAERVLKDAQQMVPRTRKSLEDAVDALDDLVVALASEDEIASSEEYKKASAQLEEVRKAWAADQA